MTNFGGVKRLLALNVDPSDLSTSLVSYTYNTSLS